ncbi:hypothetical protein LTS14_006242 [Recurvomyces mirabilis]|uniref:uncharacterized protein n=1 Tax=Recurvomyces mirabilis TaxID=574656 RepID=UPI002DDEEF0C|nr:hypothetical protein LTS14_006242 [Recurvomyces mirabilis]
MPSYGGPGSLSPQKPHEKLRFVPQPPQKPHNNTAVMTSLFLQPNLTGAYIYLTCLRDNATPTNVSTRHLADTDQPWQAQKRLRICHYNNTLNARPGLDTTSSQFAGPTKAELNLASKHDEAPLQLPDTFGKEVLFLSVICSSQLLTQAGLAMSIVPSHIIGASFDIQDESELSWFSAAYSLTIGTFILVAGRLGDVFGQKPFFIGGYLWFGIWSALAGIAVHGGPCHVCFLPSYARDWTGVSTPKRYCHSCSLL